MQTKILILFTSLLFSFSSFNNSKNNTNESNISKTNSSFECGHYSVEYTTRGSDGIPDHHYYSFDSINDANAYAAYVIGLGISASIAYNSCVPSYDPVV